MIRTVASQLIALIRALPACPVLADHPDPNPTSHMVAARYEAYLTDNPELRASDIAWLVASLAHTHAEAAGAMEA